METKRKDGASIMKAKMFFWNKMIISMGVRQSWMYIELLIKILMMMLSYLCCGIKIIKILSIMIVLKFRELLMINLINLQKIVI